MKNSTFEEVKNSVAPYQVKQAVIGIKLASEDQQLLAYLNLFFQKIPVEAAQWVHVQPDFTFVSFFLEKDLRPLIDTYEMDKELLEQMSEMVTFQIKGNQETKMTYKVTEGDPLEMILEQRTKTNADLLVIGQHTGNAYHSILAKNLIRKSPQDALIVPQQTKVQLSSILVPIDFSQNAARALKKALQIHRQLLSGTKVKVLYIYKTPKVNLSKINQTWDEYSLMVKRNIRNSLERFVERVAPDYTKAVEIQILEKEKLAISKSILKVASDNSSDLIVIGAKGHSKVERLLMGSITEQLVSKNKNTAVLVVK